MKKTQMALAAVALVASTAAMADGVSVSGRMDFGVQGASSGASVGTAKTALNGGLLAPNLLTISGNEDIGDGNTAGFNLTTVIGSGVLDGLTPYTLLSNIHVGTAAGTIRVGATVDSFWGNGLAAFDVTGGGNMGSAVTAGFMHGATGVFHENTIQYVAPSISGLNVAATYTVMDQTSATGNGTARSSINLKKGDYSVAGTYDIGSLKVGAGYASNHNYNSDVNNSFFVGAGTDLGFAKVNVLYINSSLASGIASTAGTTTAGKASTFGINSSIPLVGALTGTVGYYSTDGSAINGTNTSVGALYAMSKRTTVFANYEKATGNTVLGLGQNGAGQGTGGSIATLGVAHSF